MKVRNANLYLNEKIFTLGVDMLTYFVSMMFMWSGMWKMKNWHNNDIFPDDNNNNWNFPNISSSSATRMPDCNRAYAFPEELSQQ